MKPNRIHHAYGYVRSVIRSAARERPVAAVVYVFRDVLDLVRGRLAAKIVGWPHSYLGTGSKVLGTKGISVGINVSIKRQAWIEAVFAYNAQTFSPVIKIGRGFFASDRLHISSINRIEIGKNCLFGSGVYISDHNHGSYKGSEQSSPLDHPIKRNLVSFGPVIIGSNVWLGDNVVIVGPVKIGNGVVIGANSVVTRNVPDHVIVAGSPLRILKIFNEENGQWEKYDGIVTHQVHSIDEGK